MGKCEAKSGDNDCILEKDHTLPHESGKGLLWWAVAKTSVPELKKVSRNRFFLRILYAFIARMIAAYLAGWGLHLKEAELFALYVGVETLVKFIFDGLKTATGKVVANKIKESIIPPSLRNSWIGDDDNDRPSLVDLVEEIERKREAGEVYSVKVPRVDTLPVTSEKSVSVAPPKGDKE